MEHRFPLPLLLAAVFMAASGVGCEERPPFVVLNINDPEGVSANLKALSVGLSQESLKPVTLASFDFAIAITVTAQSSGEHQLWVETYDGDGKVLARGTSIARFAVRGTPTANLVLSMPCTDDDDCNDGLFCSGTRECRDEMCITIARPCVSAFPCVTMTCVDLESGAGTCAVAVDHAMCATGTYCNPAAGCIPGQGCQSDVDCQDQSACNGAELCVNFVCVSGVPLAVDDEDSCTLDGCNDALAPPDGPVFHATVGSEGNACASASVAHGRCSEPSGGCVACDTAQYCGPDCLTCPVEQPVCGGVESACRCNVAPAPNGSCPTGRYCDDGQCTACESAAHCGPECVQCSASLPTCGGVEVGCVADTCVGRSDFTPCVVVTTPDRSYDICVDEVCVSPGCGDASCNTPGPGFARADAIAGWEYPDTNRRQCYSDEYTTRTCPSFPCADVGVDYCGQDAQYGWDTRHAEAERYTRTIVADEPLVADNVTGLTWQGCVAGKTGSDCGQGLSTALSWGSAVQYCDGLTWAEHCDWRLPDVYELASIVSIDGVPPAIVASAFNGTPTASTWTITVNASQSGTAACVSFDYGLIQHDETSVLHFVRCVRGRPYSEGPRYSRSETTPGDPVVIDAKTGLTWQACFGGETGSTCDYQGIAGAPWVSTLAFCEQLIWAGDSDWRVPNHQEMLSIMDFRSASPAMSSEWMVEMQSADERNWTSSLTMIDIADGSSGFLPLSDDFFRVRCVRANP